MGRMALTLFCFGFFLLGDEGALAEVIPPVGKRVYILDGTTSAHGTSIQADGRLGPAGSYMRDPFSPDRKAPTVAKVVSQPRPAPLRVKPAVIVLKKQKIVGNLSFPRLKFDFERKALPRLDEVLEADFIGKIVDDANRDF